MTEDIRTLLDRAAADPEPPPIDTADVVARGRVRVRRRRFAIAGGTTIGVAAFTALTIALTTLTGPGVDSAAPENSASASPEVTPQPPSNLPQLDPAKHYYWFGDDRVDDDAGAELTGALIAYLRENYPDARSVDAVPENGTVLSKLLPIDSHFKISRYTADLAAPAHPDNVTLDDTVYEQPVYQIADYSPKATDDAMFALFYEHAGARLAVNGEDRGADDLLNVTLIPAGGFLPGTDDTRGGLGDTADGHLAEGCEPYETTPSEYNGGTVAHTFDCTETEGPDGQRILQVAAHQQNPRENVTVNTVAVTRTDGTALVLRDWPQPRIDGGHFSGEPALSIAELTDMALAMPLVDIG